MARQLNRCVVIAVAVAASGTVAQAQRFIAYECNDGSQFQVALLETEKIAYLQLDGHAYQLPKKIAYTGDRYAKGGITFWVRGNGRTTIKRAGKVSECFSVTSPGRG
jgi:membrane-bound inhibitor of C-type lysozyme